MIAQVESSPTVAGGDASPSTVRKETVVKHQAEELAAEDHKSCVTTSSLSTAASLNSAVETAPLKDDDEANKKRVASAEKRKQEAKQDIHFTPLPESNDCNTGDSRETTTTPDAPLEPPSSPATGDSVRAGTNDAITTPSPTKKKSRATTKRRSSSSDKKKETSPSTARRRTSAKDAVAAELAAAVSSSPTKRSSGRRNPAVEENGKSPVRRRHRSPSKKRAEAGGPAGSSPPALRMQRSAEEKNKIRTGSNSSSNKSPTRRKAAPAEGATTPRASSPAKRRSSRRSTTSKKKTAGVEQEDGYATDATATRTTSSRLLSPSSTTAGASPNVSIISMTPGKGIGLTAAAGKDPKALPALDLTLNRISPRRSKSADSSSLLSEPAWPATPGQSRKTLLGNIPKEESNKLLAELDNDKNNDDSWRKNPFEEDPHEASCADFAYEFDDGEDDRCHVRGGRRAPVRRSSDSFLGGRHSRSSHARSSSLLGSSSSDLFASSMHCSSSAMLNRTCSDADLAAASPLNCQLGLSASNHEASSPRSSLWGAKNDPFRGGGSRLTASTSLRMSRTTGSNTLPSSRSASETFGSASLKGKPSVDKETILGFIPEEIRRSKIKGAVEGDASSVVASLSTMQTRGKIPKGMKMIVLLVADDDEDS